MLVVNKCFRAVHCVSNFVKILFNLMFFVSFKNDSAVAISAKILISSFKKKVIQSRGLDERLISLLRVAITISREADISQVCA